MPHCFVSSLQVGFSAGGFIVSKLSQVRQIALGGFPVRLQNVSP